MTSNLTIGKTMIEKELNQAIKLLNDDNLVWSDDFENIRRNLAGLLTKAIQVEFHHLEPEIGDLALNLMREREYDAREHDTTDQNITLQDEDNTEPARNEGQRHSCCCSCKS